MPDVIKGGYTCKCGWVGNSRQALYWHRHNVCTLKDTPSDSVGSTASPAAIVSKPDTNIDTNAPAAAADPGPQVPAPSPGQAPHDVIVGAADDYPGDEQPAASESDDDIPVWVIIPLMVAAGAAVLLLLFRDKIRDFLNRRGKPPVKPVVLPYG